ncbi:MAG: hypothetical protein AAF074_13965 [Pseudomonadota bacterium]
MAVLRVNATRDGALFVPGSAGAWQGALDDALRALPAGAAVCVLVHGYRFSWRAHRGGRAHHCPQSRLYNTETVAPGAGRRPCRAAWPRALGFGEAEAGLCIAFGWDGRRDPLRALGFSGRNAFSLVYEAAAQAGSALALILDRIAERRPDVTVDFLTHSLGARVALAAMGARPAARLGRAVLLGAADYAGVAERVLEAQDRAGGSTVVYHVLSRANDLYDGLFRLFAPRPERAGDRTLGEAGLLEALPAPARARHARRWIDLQLDQERLARLLASRGIILARAAERITHWHFYADEGAMAAWRAILERAPGWEIADLRLRGLGAGTDPRWSRLLPARPDWRLAGGARSTAERPQGSGPDAAATAP